MDELSVGLRAATFFLSIFAALVALQLYNLLRAGELAQTWRSFIIGALVLAVWSLADIANTLLTGLSGSGGRIGLFVDLLRTMFVILYASGLWSQRQLFYHPDRFRPGEAGVDGVEIEHDDREDEAEAARPLG